MTDPYRTAAERPAGAEPRRRIEMPWWTKNLLVLLVAVPGIGEAHDLAIKFPGHEGLAACVGISLAIVACASIGNAIHRVSS